MLRFSLVLWLLLTSGNALYAQQYNFRNWTLEHGLPQSKVVAILQDEKKHLWVATRGGISRFDGVDFQIFTKRNGLSSNNITALFQDSRQLLWVGTADNGLNSFDGLHFTHYGQKSGLPEEGITSVTESSQGIIWVSTANGLYYLKGNSFTRFSMLPAQYYTSLVFTGDSTLWAGSRTGGLYKVKDKTITQFTQENSALPSNEITSVSKSKDDKLWIGTSQGIAFSDKNNLQVLSGVTSFITGFAFDQHDYIWVASKSNGLFRIKGKEITNITKENGLRTNNIVSIAADVENNIWIGTNGYGLQQYKAPWFSHYFRISDIEEPRITTLTQDKEGNIWVGTDNGIAANLKQDRLQQFQEKVWPSNTSIYSMLVKDKNTIWIGTSQGAWLLQNGKARQFTTANGLPADEVREIKEDASGKLWFATADGVAQFKNNTFKTIQVANDSLGHVYAMFIDSKGRLWFGAENGVYKFLDGMIRRADELKEHVIKDVTSITEDSSGTLYFGGFNYGILLYKLKTGKTRLFSTEDGLPNDGIKSLYIDKRDYLWAGTNNNVIKINLSQLREKYTLDFRRYNSQDGFRGFEVCHNCITQTSDSILWFGTAKGLTKYIFALDKQSKVYPELLFTDIKLFMRPTDWKEMGISVDSLTRLPKNLKLPFNRNHITFDFHAVSLYNPSRIRYKYKLEGYDDEWSGITEVSSATYANLGPGKYSFNVIAQNSDGIWTPESLTYTFSVNAPLWRREWFMGLVLLLISGAILTIVRLRERGLRNMNKLLDLRVKHRTHLLERKHREKEMLLKEIHHRVKNNLQIVISLLNLQARHVKDNQTKEAMQAIRSRVRSMSLLHERLYQHDNLAFINLENYFREICESLYEAFGVTEEEIELMLHIPPIKLDIDAAITLGLIVNELVSNSLKYAFEKGKSGKKLTITLEKSTNRRYILTVADNGVGIPENLDKQENTPFGLNLVASLSKKLEGKLHVENKNGTNTILYFVLPS